MGYRRHWRLLTMDCPMGAQSGYFTAASTGERTGTVQAALIRHNQGFGIHHFSHRRPWQVGHISRMIMNQDLSVTSEKGCQGFYQTPAVASPHCAGQRLL